MLIPKDDNSFLIATRHFAHTFRGKAEAMNKDVFKNLPQISQHDAVQERMKDIIPDNIFVRKVEPIDEYQRIGDMFSDGQLTIRQAKAKVQEITLKQVGFIEQDATDVSDELKNEIPDDAHKKFTDLADRLLADFYVSSSNTDRFVDESISRRFDKLQQLLDHTSPSQMAGMLNVDYKLGMYGQETFKRMRSDFDTIMEAAVENGGRIEEQLIDHSIETNADDVCTEYFYEPCVAHATQTFAKNDSLRELMGKISKNADLVYEKTVNKTQDLVDDNLDEIAKEYGIVELVR